MSAAPAVQSRRRPLLGKVHIARKALGLDEDTYRDLLQQRYGKRSSADLSDRQLVDLVEHFKTQGFKPAKPAAAPARAGTAKLAEGDQQRKLRALWLSLYHLGIIAEPSEAALTAFVKRVSGGKSKGGIDALQWLDGAAAYKAIEALKSWAAREAGVTWTPYRRFGEIIGENPRGRVIEAQWRLIQKAGLRIEFVEVLKLGDAEADAIIERQGAIIRRASTAKGRLL